MMPFICSFRNKNEKAQGVKRKRRASLGLTTGVGSIYSVPSPNGEAKRNFEFIGKDKDRQLEPL